MRTEKNAGIFQLSNQRYGKLWKKSIRNIVPTGAETGHILQSENRTAYGRTISVPDLENGI